VKQLDGMSSEAIDAAAAAAKAKGHEGKWLVDLRNTTTQPALAELTDRALRERIFKASIARNGRGNEFDNKPIIARLAQLRAQKAKLLGFPTWAHYVMDDQMAKSPDQAMKLLSGMAPAAAANARKEAAVESRRAAKALRASGLTVRDIGAALGVSFQRAHQLVKG
jgi:peptidyl-dipeptidase Dcp